ncbi:MAG: type II toxin-antitoxin system mRNA interferase toxin, RelE/StbE family [Candidatus Wildermuthbacteria bacterium]|nr:type II toxin-antitoxin system mRNA interferase toxin, RelE/StbE family [Candidatus Wildermuthbacteria bacterium]
MKIQKIYYSSKFEREYKKLPAAVRETAKTKEALFRINPFDPSLKTHKLKGGLREFFSFSLSHRYRIIFVFGKTGIAHFYSVGDHSVYQLFD